MPDEMRARVVVLQSGIISGAQLDELLLAANKSILELTPDDVREHAPLLIDSRDPFQLNLAALFLTYHELWQRNDLQNWRHSRGRSTEGPGLSDQDFVKRYGPPPWDVVNDTLAALSLDYAVAPIDHDGEDILYDGTLTHGATGDQIGIGDLSSGERVVMALALALYGASNLTSAIELPRVLLLDEPDASLHPSMVKTLLGVVEDVFVQRGVIVMMTTHSPTTVALAPEASIFVMRRGGQPRLKSASRDEALRELTVGLPTLSVSVENRRQVFVESEDDEACYSELYSILRPSLASALSLQFIASGRGGEGNATAVKDLVARLRGTGNVSVWGIVDRDTRGGAPSGIVYTPERYSIENLILDPLALGAFLLRERLVRPVAMGLAESATDDDVADHPQVVCDYIVGSVLRGAEVKELVPVDYFGGFAAEVPRFWLDVRGHDLEDRVMKTFPALNQYRRGLKLNIVSKALRDNPVLIPKAAVNLFEDVLRRASGAQPERGA